MRRPGPDGKLVKLTVAFPADVVAALGGESGSARATIRRIVTDAVRSRVSAEPERDPETDGAGSGAAV